MADEEGSVNVTHLIAVWSMAVLYENGTPKCGQARSQQKMRRASSGPPGASRWKRGVGTFSILGRHPRPSFGLESFPARKFKIFLFMVGYCRLMQMFKGSDVGKGWPAIDPGGSSSGGSSLSSLHATAVSSPTMSRILASRSNVTFEDFTNLFSCISYTYHLGAKRSRSTTIPRFAYGWNFERASRYC